MPKNIMTPQQIDVTNHREGPAVVIAGAGTGKTYTICQRIASLVENGVRPEEIMLLTFTKAAAREMQQRVADTIGQERANKLQAGNFHTIATKMLRRYGWEHTIQDADGFIQKMSTKNFEILSSRDNTDTIAFVLEQFEDERCRTPLKDINFPSPAQTAAILSERRNRGLDDIADVLKFDKYRKFRSQAIIRQLDAFDQYYDEYKQNINVMNYDDLIENLVELIARRPQICKTIAYLMVDEAQDMNASQYEIIDIIAENMDPQNIMLVGDSAQSIYGWRGSDVHLFDRFATQYSAKQFHLSSNFRSQKEILDVANNVLAGSNIALTTRLVPGRQDLAATRPNVVCETMTPRHEADQTIIVENELMRRPRDKTLAVLGRTGNELRMIERNLIMSRTPYNMYGGLKFNELDSVRDSVTMVRMALREGTVTDAECARLMTNYEQIGTKTAYQIARNTFPRCLKEHGFEHGRGKRANAVRKMCQELAVAKITIAAAGWPNAMREACDWYLSMYGKQQLLTIHSGRSKRNIADQERELKESIKESARNLDILCDMAENEPSLTTFLDEIMLESPNTKNEDAEITLSTIHSAKGLEWDRVVLLNATDDTFPGHPRESDPKLAEEEREESRRCLYVAVTRARDRLVICCPQIIIMNGQPTGTIPSRYL